MSSRIAIACLLGLLAAGCDRQSPPAGQATPAAANTADTAATASPDEATPAATRPAAGKVDSSHKGEAAPTAAFTDPAGKPATLAAFRGAPVLVNLWATWCAPCVAEMPTLDRLAARGGVRVLALSQDMKADAVAPFLKARGFARLEPYTDDQMAVSLALGANLPTTILYDAEGREVWRVTGAMDWTSAETAKLIAEG